MSISVAFPIVMLFILPRMSRLLGFTFHSFTIPRVSFACPWSSTFRSPGCFLLRVVSAFFPTPVYLAMTSNHYCTCVLNNEMGWTALLCSIVANTLNGEQSRFTICSFQRVEGLFFNPSQELIIKVDFYERHEGGL